MKRGVIEMAEKDFSEKKGSLTIDSENIFPIIKKWLYQDHDIFYRELISNGCDAVTKLKKLALIGEYGNKDEKYRIDVYVDPDEKTITVEDNGIGMTSEEVDQYINRVAFSGAADFLKKYKDKATGDQIIGHFGLGFYSAFMVADKVTIDSLSYKEGSVPVHWESDGGTEYSMSEGKKDGHGTTVKLYVNEDSLEFCNRYKAYEVIDKYCGFMPVEIYLHDVKEEAEKAKKAEEEAKKDDSKSSAQEAEKPVNDTNPLWNENPSKVTKEQYIEFYHKVFHDYKEPLFWIHLNMDYPFNLKGILYFPKVNTKYDNLEGTIKLYNTQVFIADNIKEVIPEYLMLLKGTIDCPDLPLNVSRSALQNDGFVRKISDYITKKVAEKLSGMFKVDRENYEKYWDDISPFIKYGCIRDEKFGEKMKGSIIFKDLEGKYITLPEYLGEDKKAEEAKPSEDKAENAGAAEEKTEEKAEGSESGETKEEKSQQKKTVYYVTDEKEQAQYINMFKKESLNALILDQIIDTPFIGFEEEKNENVSFVRIDSDLTEAVKDENASVDDETEKKDEKLCGLFKKVLSNDSLNVKVESLKNPEVAAMMTMSEEGRRMQEMMKMYAMYGMPAEELSEKDLTLVLNRNNDLVKRLMSEEEAELSEMMVKQLYDLAYLSHGNLSPERMTDFIKRSQELMMKLK